MATLYYPTGPEIKRNGAAFTSSNGVTHLSPQFSQHHIIRDPHTVQVYLIGGGIASLAAASHLIKDAQVQAKNIHILESSGIAGGSMDAAGDPSKGYIFRGGRMLNFSYLCLYELLGMVPSLTDPNKTVRAEIHDFNAIPANKTHAHARIVQSNGDEGPNIADVNSLGLDLEEKVDLVKMMVQSEASLGEKRIEECFPPTFFETNFWYMWATMFAFQPWHSAVEFRRYLHRFIHELTRINTLAGVERTPYNQYDSIILPITTNLQKLGVDFQYNTTVTDLSFTDKRATTVGSIHYLLHGQPEEHFLQVRPSDVVMVTLGSMTSGSKIGTHNSAPDPVPLNPATTTDGAWGLWNKLSAHSDKFGNPDRFSTRISESIWESFSVTMRDPEQTFFNLLYEFTGNVSGTGALTTFKDSNWLMSIVVPHQPHFLGQPEDVQVFWGYGLSTWKEGNFVKKPMTSCTGTEIMTELLGHLRFPVQGILDTTICIPCTMPYITAQFLTRNSGKNGERADRPQVIPEGSVNLAFLGQFVEIPEDVVFTVEYSVRGAQMAVYEMMGVDKKPKSIYKGGHHVTVLREGLNAMLR